MPKVKINSSGCIRDTVKVQSFLSKIEVALDLTNTADEGRWLVNIRKFVTDNKLYTDRQLMAVSNFIMKEENSEDDREDYYSSFGSNW